MRKEGESENNMGQEGATYGSWEEGSFMEDDFWDKHIEKRRIRIEAEEKERKARQEKARRQEQSWELARVCKELIAETSTGSWYQNKEIREEREKAEKAKKERFKVIKEKILDLEKGEKRK